MVVAPPKGLAIAVGVGLGLVAPSAFEAVAELAAMIGFPEAHLGHLTSGGTVANLEALWVARELRPGRAVAVSSQAHYTHARAAGDGVGAREQYRNCAAGINARAGARPRQRATRR